MRTEQVSTLKRRATELLSEVVRDREPILITQDGVPSAYLVAVGSYDQLQQRVDVLEGIIRGETALAEGRGVPHTKARTRMSRWLK